MEGSQERITREVASWPGVSVTTGSRGEHSFRLGRREIGHLHGDRVLHIGFARDVWQQLFDAGRLEHHPVFPGRPGMGQRRIADAEDETEVIALLRLAYERRVARDGLPTAA